MKEILIIEDEPGHVELIKRAFRYSDNYKLNIAVSLKEASVFLENNITDLIISDWKLPDGKGIEILNYDSVKEKIPVIITTSYGSQELAVEAIKSGALDYVAKSPASYSDMAHIVARAFREWDNIHEKKKIEAALIKSEEQLRLLNKNMPDIITFADPDGKFIYVSPSIENVLGIKPDEMTGRSVFGRIHPDDVARLENEFNNLKSANAPKKTDFRIMNGSGDYIWIETIGNMIFDKNESITGFVFNSRLIGDRKKEVDEIKRINEELEEMVNNRTFLPDDASEKLSIENQVPEKAQEDLNRVQEELEDSLSKEKELNVLKSRFMGMIANEYRAPLTLMLSSTYLLEEYFEKGNRDKFLKYLKKIRNSIHSLNSGLDNLAVIRDSESGAVKAKPEYIDLTAMTRDVIEEVKLMNDLRPEIIFSTNRREINLNTDKRLYRSIVMNLLNIALRNSSANNPIEVELNRGEKEIRLTVIQKSFGIEEDDMKYLLEPFDFGIYKGSLSTTGLGYSVIRACVEAMNADIDISGSKDELVKMTIIFPADN